MSILSRSLMTLVDVGIVATRGTHESRARGQKAMAPKYGGRCPPEVSRGTQGREEASGKEARGRRISRGR